MQTISATAQPEPNKQAAPEAQQQAALASDDDEVLFRPQQQRDIIWRWQMRRRTRPQVA